jgi:hypothetical protein
VQSTEFRLIRIKTSSLAQKPIAMNPHQVPAIDRSLTPRYLTWLVCALILAAWGAMIVTLSRFFGSHGFGLSLYAVACSWFIISRMDFNLLSLLNRFKPTLTEWLVVLAICGVLHGLSLPAVSTNCVGRRQSIGPPATSANQAQSGRVMTTPTSSDTPK